MGVPERARVPVSSERMARAALRAFIRIAEQWRLTVDEQVRLLGSPARSTYFKWKKEGAASLPRDVLERISYVLGIYKALQVLLPDERAADAWVRKPNAAPVFGGRTALERMLSGNVADLYEVRRYLDAERGAWM